MDLPIGGVELAKRALAPFRSQLTRAIDSNNLRAARSLQAVKSLVAWDGRLRATYELPRGAKVSKREQVDSIARWLDSSRLE